MTERHQAYLALRLSNTEVVEALLAGGADPNRMDDYGNGLLGTAVQKACLARRTDRHLAVVRLLLVTQRRYSPSE